MSERSHFFTLKRLAISANANHRQIKYMLILHLSDTHSKHHELRNLPPADIIIHSGDISFAGSENEVMDFIEWFGALPYKYKIFIAGNHDDCLFGANIDGLPQNCFYLCNSSVTIQGVKFYGIPCSAKRPRLVAAKSKAPALLL